MNNLLLGDQITVIDFSKTNADIHNLDALPPEARKVWDSAESISSRGFQEINGYIGRQMIWSCGGYWTDDKFHITSMGNGSQLFVEGR